MRIEAYTQVQQMYKTNNTRKSQNYAGAKAADQVQISDLGQNIQAAKPAVMNAPDIREDKVAPIKEAINNGTYEVSGETFADKLLQKYNEMR